MPGSSSQDTSVSLLPVKQQTFPYREGKKKPSPPPCPGTLLPFSLGSFVGARQPQPLLAGHILHALSGLGSGAVLGGLQPEEGSCACPSAGTRGALLSEPSPASPGTFSPAHTGDSGAEPHRGCSVTSKESAGLAVALTAPSCTGNLRPPEEGNERGSEAALT